ncbi:hypothetical protein [Acidiphilium sp.]|uniref:phage adaptor protein n=1 Tax=Acidiphilium sp. TaxID=527 RepID=UPI00258E4D9D|nr:hypothetical protein [Acidiphilium sp.]
MAITDFASLKTAIAARLSRSNMTALIPDFVTIAHAKMLNGDPHPDPRDPKADLPALRCTDMLATEVLTLSGGQTTLPADYLEARRFFSDDGNELGISYIPPERWYTLALTKQAGVPQFYTIEGTTLKVGPIGNYDLNLLYYQRLDVPDAAADTNFIFSKAPHAYLYGALAEAYDHIRQPERSIFYHNQFASAVRALIEQAERAEASGSTLIMRPDAIT